MLLILASTEAHGFYKFHGFILLNMLGFHSKIIVLTIYSFLRFIASYCSQFVCLTHILNFL